MLLADIAEPSRRPVARAIATLVRSTVRVISSTLASIVSFRTLRQGYGLWRSLLLLLLLLAEKECSICIGQQLCCSLPGKQSVRAHPSGIQEIA